MKKQINRLISVILALSIAFSLSAYAENTQTQDEEIVDIEFTSPAEETSLSEENNVSTTVNEDSPTDEEPGTDIAEGIITETAEEGTEETSEEKNGETIEEETEEAAEVKNEEAAEEGTEETVEEETEEADETETEETAEENTEESEAPAETENEDENSSGEDSVGDYEEEPLLRIWITSSLEGVESVESGTPITLTAHLEGFEELSYRLQWQYSLDGENWKDEPGADEISFHFVLDESNDAYIWRVIAILGTK